MGHQGPTLPTLTSGARSASPALSLSLVVPGRVPALPPCLCSAQHAGPEQRVGQSEGAGAGHPGADRTCLRLPRPPPLPHCTLLNTRIHTFALAHTSSYSSQHHRCMYQYVLKWCVEVFTQVDVLLGTLRLPITQFSGYSGLREYTS